MADTGPRGREALEKLLADVKAELERPEYDALPMCISSDPLHDCWRSGAAHVWRVFAAKIQEASDG